MRGHRLVLFASLAVVTGALLPAVPSGADGTDTCKINMYPTAPGGASEVSVGCFLKTSTGAAGSKYVFEDFPQAVWHSGAARVVTTSAATAAGSKVLTSATGHFGAADINNGVAGTGIAANSFIVSVAGNTATLNNAAVAPGVANGAKLIVESNDSRTLVDATFVGATITSPLGHFCKPALGNCGTKTDVGKAVSGTQIPHMAKIASVTDATHAVLSAASTACPAGVSATNCKQISLDYPDTAPPATTRLLRDVTVAGGNTLCSASAAFQASDVNLPVLTAAGANPPAGARFIASVGSGAPCAAGTTKAVLNAGGVANGVNQVYVIGQANASAPATGTAVSWLGSELLVNPALSPGLPSCTSGIVTAAVLGGRWNNPGAFVTALGAVSGVTTPGPIIGQIEYNTGTPAFNFTGYVVKVKAATAGESDTAADYDIYLPALLTGVAVCATPTVGVTTTFRWNVASVASASGAATPGEVRSLADFATGSKPGTAYEKIYAGATLKLNKPGSCTVTYPPVNGFNCGGNG